MDHVLRRFYLQRDDDVTGVSGTGVIAEGVEFSNGTAVFCWLSDRASLVVFPASEGGVTGIEDKHGHDGRTRVVWLDERGSTDGKAA